MNGFNLEQHTVEYLELRIKKLEQEKEQSQNFSTTTETVQEIKKEQSVLLYLSLFNFSPIVLFGC